MVIFYSQLELHAISAAPLLYIKTVLNDVFYNLIKKLTTEGVDLSNHFRYLRTLLGLSFGTLKPFSVR